MFAVLPSPHVAVLPSPLNHHRVQGKVLLILRGEFLIILIIHISHKIPGGLF